MYKLIVLNPFRTTVCTLRLIGLITLLAASNSFAQSTFVAFNDHAPGAGTAPNTTIYSADPAQVGGTGGFMTNVATGARLNITLTVTVSGNVTFEGTQGTPNSGTPLYNAFNTFVDFTGTPNPSLALNGAGATYTYTFTGLDPNKRYSFKGGAIRNNAYIDRYTLVELQGAVSYRPNHQGVSVLTSNQVPAIQPNQAAFNFDPPAEGNMADFEDIDPGGDGTFAIVCSQYQGTVPGGSSGGAKGYGITGIRLEEFNTTPVAAAITNQPSSTNVLESQPATFIVGAKGVPSPNYQWYRDNSPISGETNASYTLAAAATNDNGAVFKVVVSNVTNGVPNTVTSSDATLTVTPDTTAPVLVRALSVADTSVLVTYSEPVTELTATNLANYSITNAAGAVLTISNAVLQANGSNVVLTTALQAQSATYTVVINGIRDRAAAANQIAANSTSSFSTTSGYTTADVGSPGQPGSFTQVSGGFNVAGSGADIGANSDQFTFAYQQRGGDFDLRVRIAGLTQPDTWTKAGIMARQTPIANSSFAATFASPSLGGAFFESRLSSGATATLQGTAPVNFPSTWLRLQRVGNVFTGYASFDGTSWLQLGSSTIVMSDPVYVGYAVSSHTNSTTAIAQFRDIGPATGATTVTSLTSPVEPPGPSSRKTPFAITEIMYKPAPRTDGRTLEFVEVYNSNPFFEDISGFKLSGDIEYTFPANTIMPGGSYLVIAKVPTDVQAVYGISGVLGPYTNSLSANGTVRLRNNLGHILLEVNYSNDPPWPAAADGAGHSLVLARPSYGEGYVQGWAASDSIGGSPGGFDGYTADPLRSVVINEFLANTTNVGGEFIELYNHGNVAVNISGAWLSDDPSTNKFRIPDGTIIPIRSFVTFTEAQLNFSLNAEGEGIYLVNSNRTRVIDAVKFDAQSQGITSGRYPDGFTTLGDINPWYPLQTSTPGAPNSPILINDIVINELMYSPISENNDDEFIELYNKGTNSVDLSDWRLNAGVSFTFPSNLVIAPNGYLVVAKNRTNLFTHYPTLNTNNTVGDYGGTLKNGGERVALARPELHIRYTDNGVPLNPPITNTIHVAVDEVTYTSGGKWGKWSGGGGSSLELIDPRSNHRLPSNWADSDESHKANWTIIDVAGTLDNGAVQSGSIDRLEVSLAGEGEALLDNVEVLNSSQANMLSPANSTFEGLTPGLFATAGNWTPQGDQIHSTLETTEGYGGTSAPNQPGQSLHIRASSRGDSGANRIRVAFGNPGTINTTNLGAGTACTIRAKVRWLKGWPEVLLRIKGNYHEAWGRMSVPFALGTPGARNSQAATNTGPAIYSVSTSPVLPAANIPVVVSCRVTDPDGVASLQLKYRVDPATTYTAVNMLDDGTGGDAIANDGVFSATIPGQAANTLVAFIIQAGDGGTPSLTNTYPPGAYNYPAAPSPVTPAADPHYFAGNAANGIGRAPYPGEPATGHEGLIRFGDPVNARTDGNTSPQSFGIYRYFLTQNSVNTWINRPSLSNERVEGTFVYGNFRAIYEMSAKYSGSPYHQGFSSPVANQCHYSIEFPGDDLLLGTANFNKIHAPGNGPWDDTTCQREQAGYWLYHKMGLPSNYRRSVNFIINGQRRSGNALMEDSQTPGGDVVSEIFPDDDNGNLYKLQPWFEFDDVNVTGGSGAGFVNESWCLLNNLTTTGGIKKSSRFRQNYLARAVHGSANDYADVYTLVDAISAPTSQTNATTFMQNLEALVDIEEWLRVSSVEHGIGDWDSFLNRNAQNMYGYKPTQGKWTLMKWDCNIIFNNSGSDGPGVNLFQYQTADTNVVKLYNIGGTWGTWAYRRMYWRALKELATVHWPNPQFFQMLDAKYNAYQINGLTSIGSPQPIKDFVNQAAPSMLTQLVQDGDKGIFVAGTNAVIGITNNLLTLQIVAPVDAKTIKINGVEYPITWTGLSTGTVVIAVPTGDSTLTAQGYDINGNIISNYNANVFVTYTGPVVRPQDALVINEIMYHPAVSNAAYIEILNSSSLAAFDLSNWRLDGLDYTFPAGTVISNKQFLVIAKNRATFTATYGSSIPVLGEFNGNFDPDGEKISLIKPASNPSGQDEVIDAVRYEAILPWPTTAAGGGAALQLIDASQDNSRVSNWSDGAGWRYFSGTAAPGVGSATNNFTINMDSAGDFYLDDISLVAGTVAGTGVNLFQNGDFETGLIGPWVGIGNHNGSAVSTSVKHSGNASLHVVSTGAGSTLNTIIQSNIVTINTNYYTLSFWYLPSPNASNLNYRLTSNFRSTATNTLPAVSIKPTQFTPGAANTIAVAVDPYPLLWINEVQPNNVNGITDVAAEHDPWIELYNSGTNAITLDGYALANNYTNLAQWPFPNGTVINPGEFRVLFVDGQPGQSSGSELHASFRLAPTNGAIVLSKAGRILDYINYSGMLPNYSYGSYPDGQLLDRQGFFYTTPGAPNNPAPVPVIINEWMAANTNSIVDPATGKHEDWFELYNFGSVPIDLSGYYLTDDLGKKKNWQIPNGVILGPTAFLLVFADNAATNSPDILGQLHANFNLSKNGEQLGLYNPAGLLVDGVTFGPQQNDISQGRYPDGNFGGVLYFMTSPTPGGANQIPSNQFPPVLPTISNKSVNERNLLSFLVAATDNDNPVQTLTYSLLAGAPAGAAIDRLSGAFTWTPTELQGGATYPVTVRVSDNGSPTFTDSKSFNITVNKVNSPPDVPLIPPQTLPEQTALSVTIAASDSDIPAQHLSFGLLNQPSGMTIDPGTGTISWTPSEAQGPSTNNFLVRVTDDGSPSMSTTQSMTVFVTEVNTAPTLQNPGTQVIDEGKLWTNQLIAADSDLPTNSLSYAVLSVAPTVQGLTITAGGRLSWTPSETNGPGSYVVTVKVADNGSPSLSATQQFTITVNEVNAAPIMTNLNNTSRSIAELTSITLTNIATDTDSPPNIVTFEIVSAPSGATVNSTNGIFTWTPSEAQGPSTNIIAIRAVDNGVPSLSATQSFTIIVTEVNSAPVLSPIPDKTVNSGQTLTFTNVVTDSDLPPNILTFTLVGGPTGANLDPSTGVFSWTPNGSQTPSTNNMSIIVADNGTPSLSATQSFKVIVSLGGPNITSIHLDDSTHLTITWDSVSGQPYYLESCADLSGLPNCWQFEAGTQITANSSSTQKQLTISASPSQRFYRVVQGTH